MSDDRENGPHYIPELDPENPRHRKNVMHWYWLFSIPTGLVSWGVAAYAYDQNMDVVAILFGIIGFVLLLPVLIAVGLSVFQ